MYQDEVYINLKSPAVGCRMKPPPHSEEAPWIIIQTDGLGADMWASAVTSSQSRTSDLCPGHSVLPMFPNAPPTLLPVQSHN